MITTGSSAIVLVPSLQYRWHTLPAFIPLSAMISKYNSGDIQVRWSYHILPQYLLLFQ